MFELRFGLLILGSSLVTACGASTEPIVDDAAAPMDGAVRRDAGVDAGPGLPDAGGPAECIVLDDCTWGEIEREILSPVDCPCLYGCPFAAMNRATAARRNAQYTALCDPRRDGMGNPCGIDDCAMPPPIACIGGTCSGPPPP